MIAPVPAMERQLRRLATSTATLLVCLATLATAATAAPPGPSTGLHVGAGSVKVLEGKLKGSATIANGGPPLGRRAYVSLIVQLTGPDRLLRRTAIDRLPEGATKTIGYSLKLPTTLPIGRHPIWVCVSRSPALPEPSVLTGCREVGGVNVPVPRLVPPKPVPSEAPPTKPVANEVPTPKPVQTEPSVPAAPSSTVPTAPIAYEAGQPQVLNDAGNGYYWLDVPAAYDASNQTPMTLFVWLHGCGGRSSGDIYTVSPETVGSPARPRDWISIAVGGTDDGCWIPSADEGLVKNAIADVETHFNIDRHRVILGGYSSGGDLAYRLAFYGGTQFAGVLAENTSPFRDTESTEAASLAAAGWKFPVVHLAHLQDTEYPITGVREETDAMIAAGFPLTRIEVDGGHYDEPGEIENGHAVPGTDADLVSYLLPHIDDGWRSP
jgi:pimeloyl-ACP methyl ester carboxylesterase